MKILLVTGSFPPDVCGVGDYSCHLFNELQKLICIEIFCYSNWKFRNIFKIIGAIKKLKPDIIHIQYPTVGFGKSIIPQMLTLFFTSIVTIHEVSQAHFLRKLACIPFFFISRHVLFTTSYERHYVARIIPWIVRKSSVIPIGSNIPKGNLNLRNGKHQIVCFGLIRPKKGLEKTIEFASLIKKLNIPYRIHIVGMPDSRYSDYLKHLQELSLDLPVDWSLDLSESEVANLLAQTKFGYLPFPDGASERRGSLLALLANGVVTLTTKGTHTPGSLNNVVEFADSPEETVMKLKQLLNNEDRCELLKKNSLKYAEGFLWATIAWQHVYVYQGISENMEARYLENSHRS